jgi:hypothetical protein
VQYSCFHICLLVSSAPRISVGRPFLVTSQLLDFCVAERILRVSPPSASDGVLRRNLGVDRDPAGHDVVSIVVDIHDNMDVVIGTGKRVRTICRCLRNQKKVLTRFPFRRSGGRAGWGGNLSFSGAVNIALLS